MGTIKVAETIGFILILLPAILANNQILVNIFGNRVFNVIVKFVYATYLIHLIVISYRGRSTRNTLNFTYENVIYYSL